ncbi:Tail-specific protease [invertebrate metagenome]|uniref:Tail-specific protease n=1 Tax=invertebrate metagenome TaxID=1711999 RepID=A0A2H9TAM0_9ZZZZ
MICASPKGNLCANLANKQIIQHGVSLLMIFVSQRTRSLILVLLLFVFTRSVIAADQDLTKSVTALQPDFQQAMASVRLHNNLERYHYRKLPMDQVSADKIFERYLERLDPNRSFFLQSDIDDFQSFRKRLTETLKTGDLRPAFDVYNRYRQRAEFRARYMLDQIDKWIRKIDLTRNDELVIDRKKLPWLKDQKEQQILWDKQLKDSIIALKLNNKTDDEVADQLRRRNTNSLRRLHQSKDEDAFQIWMNAYASVYDPHTQYFSPQTAENFDINMSLSLEGIGAVLQSEDEYTKVVSIITGGPAEKAGDLKPGDKIVGVAQGRWKPKSKGKGKAKGKDAHQGFEDIVGLRLDDAVKLIRGKKGTWVSLEVISGSSKSGIPKIYEIQRDKVKLEEQDASSRIIDVTSHRVNKKIGVIELPTFYIDFKGAQNGEADYKSTTRDVKRLLNGFQKERVDGVIIDLRGNGGGSLQEANDLTGLFIHEGPTVVVRDGRGRTERQSDTNSSQFYGGPLMVLVDRLSASASEIFAGAMQDYGRALVVGSQTYGKGTVQTIQPLRNGGQLKLTMAKFYRISGKSTQNKGVLPDILFPSLYDGRDIGENTLLDALPWDTIASVPHRSYGNLKPYLTKLKSAHDKRVEKNPDFIYLKEIKDYMSRYENIEKVSLNEKTRKIQIETMRSQRLAIENRLRKAKGEPLLNNLDELDEKAEEAKNKKDDEKQKEKDKPDAFMEEAGMIFMDFMDMTVKPKRMPAAA